MNQIETKTILAKLLATEDISIVHDPKMQTAAFDVKARKLYLPVWQEMSNDLYDLFIGHEVGHARNTPEEGWHDAVCDTPNLKAFYNIVEDARIERKIKAQYPGLVKSFHKGYQELFDKDFFGVKGKDLSTLPFVDRVNLHFKIGHLLGLKFTETEQSFLDRVGQTETWDDVKKLSLELADMSKQEAEDRQDEMEPIAQELQDLLDELAEKQDGTPEYSDFAPESEEEEGDDAGEGEGTGSSDDTDEEGNPKPGTKGGPQGEDESEEEFNDRQNKEWMDDRAEQRAKWAKEEAEREAQAKAMGEYEKASAEHKEETKKIEDEIADTKKMHDFLNNEGQKSITDDAFRENETSLVQLDAEPIVYLDLPTRFNSEELVIQMEELYDWDACIDLEQAVGTDYWDTRDVPKDELKSIANTMYQEFTRTSNPIVASMAQQFEMKKAAAASKKNQTSKTGKLNEDKLWAYKLTEDLFQSTTMIPNGKNHGIIMYVDLSGSMHKSMSGTIEQMLNMALFCRKVNVPFDVYGFSDRHSDFYYDENDDFVQQPTPFSKNKDVEQKILRDTKDGEIIQTDDGFRLVHMLSSTCKKADFINAVSYLLLTKVGYDRYNYGSRPEGTYFGHIRNRYLSLGGTPLNSAILASFSMAERFQKKYNVEILTTIFLTDGGATDQIIYRNSEMDTEDRIGVSSVYSDAIAIKKGPVVTKLPSKKSYSRYNGVTTHTMLEHYKRITGSTVINFHIVDGKKGDFHRECFSAEWMEEKEMPRWIDGDWEQTTWKEILRNKFTMTKPKFGYDARFLIKGANDLNVGDDELVVKSTSKGDLLRGFRKFNSTKKSSRQFLNKIIEMVA